MLPNAIDYRVPLAVSSFAMLIILSTGFAAGGEDYQTHSGDDAKANSKGQRRVEYNRDVRPILADKCFRCHGPDAAARQADLRLDHSEAVTAPRDGLRVIEPGRPSQSELLRRLKTSDEAERMPPLDAGSRLDDAEIAILSAWIEQGATYQQHWSFVAPRRPQVPSWPNHTWSDNPIDRFVCAAAGEAT